MNRIYRLVWSRTQQAWVPVSEISGGLARGGNKSTRSKLLVASLTLCSAVAQANPSGGVVTAGAGTVDQIGQTTTIQQNSQNLSLNWDSFNIATKDIVNFVQPSASAIAVNRIFDTSATQILGQLNANGQVYLINPNGIIFGQGSQVNVGGLVASTLDVNEASLNSNSKTFSGTGTGSITNKGNLVAASGGYIALLANQVSNQGIISAQLGTVALAGGSNITLTFADNSLVQVQVNQSTLNNLAENKQLVVADGGQVFMSAGAKNSLLASVVNNTGIIEAQTVSSHEGVINLMGGMEAGTVNVGGTLDASAPKGGNGGAIETSAATVKVADNTLITTAAPTGNTGNWLVDPTDYTVAASGGDMTGTALTSSLATTNVTLQSSSGVTGTAGNININDTVNWSANKLTLNAQNNININAAMTATSTASLALNYGLSAVATSNTSQINTGTTGSVNLPASTTNLTTTQGSNGVQKTYTVITALGNAADASTALATTPSLQGMAATANLSTNFALGSNIDASSTSIWNSGAGFTPIGKNGARFAGSFNGLGHTISNLSINLPSTSRVGLFGENARYANISNVGLVGGSVSGDNSIGGLVGANYGSISNSYATVAVSGKTYVGGLVGANNDTITNSYATGAVSGIDGVGGLVGMAYGRVNGYDNNSGAITYSYATGAVSGIANVGGLVGNSEIARISNSYATGTVSGNSDIGGLLGRSGGSNISNSYATGRVSGSSYVGGLVGAEFYHGYYRIVASISNSFYNSSVNPSLTGVDSNAGHITDVAGTVKGLTTSQLTDSANFTGWTFTTTPGQTNAWVIVNADGSLNANGTPGGGTTPMLASEYSTTINNAHQLQLMAMDLGASYTLGSNINAIGSGTTLSASTTLSSTNITGPTATLLVGASISGAGIPNGAIILSITSATQFVISAPSTATASGVTLQATGNDVWGSAGFTPIQTFTGVFNGLGHTINDLTINRPLSTSVGLFGTNSGGNISNIGLVGGSVTGLDNVGALVGFNLGTISNSYTSGLVFGHANIGGLVGHNEGGTSTISNSYTLGVITGNDFNIGGLIGLNVYGTISNSYATGTVNGNGFNIGGLLGLNILGTISNSYATAVLTENTSNNGGLVGSNNGTIINSFYNSGVKFGLTGAGDQADSAGNVLGLSFTAMRDSTNFTNAMWDFSTIWGMSSVINGGNPYLLSNTPVLSLSTSPTTTTIYLNLMPGTSVYGSTPTYTLYTGTGTPTAGTYFYNTSPNYLMGTFVTNADATGTIAWSGMPTSSSNAQTLPYSVSYSSGLTLGNSAYSLAAGNLANWLVTPKALTESGLTVASSKTYDGTTTATPLGTAALTLEAAGTGSSTDGKAYSGDDVSLTGTATGTYNNANVLNANTVTLAGLTLTGASAGNYTLTELATQAATITPKALTESGLTVASSKTYDGTTQAVPLGTASLLAQESIGTGSSTDGKAYSGDDVSLTGTATGTYNNANVASASSVTLGGLTLTGASAGNYTLTALGTQAATISAKALEGTITTGSSVYGADLAPGAVVFSNLVGTDSVNAGTVTVNTANNTSASHYLNAGTYSGIQSVGASLSGTSASNYSFAGLTGNYTVNKLALTGALAGSSIYGAALSFTPVTFSNVITGDSVFSASAINVAINTSSYISHSGHLNAGTYTGLESVGGSLAGTSAGNYSFAGLSGDYTVNKLPLTGSIATGSSVYGASLSPGAVSFTNAVSGDQLTATVAVNTPANVSTNNHMNVGDYAAQQSVAALSGQDAGNYSFAGLTGNYNVTPATLTVTATNQTRVYGAENPTFIETISGFVNGDTADVVVKGTGSASSSATKTTGVGSTVLIASNKGLSATNYNFNKLTNGTLAITPATLTVTANNQTRVYGAVNPTFTETITGFVNRDTVAVVKGTARASTIATATTGVGSAVLTASNSGLSATNYNFNTLVNGALTITPATLTVTARNQTRVYGAENPTFIETISGFVNGDTADVVVNGTARASTIATKTTGVGSTVLTASNSGLSATNYNFNKLINGALTITPATLTVTASNQTRVYGAENPTFIETISGFVNNENEAVVKGTVNASSSATKTTGVGSTVLIASNKGLLATNYNFNKLINGALTITPATLTVTANNQTRVYGAVNPTFDQSITGFVNGEKALSVVKGKAIASSTASATTAAGGYVIDPSNSGLSAANYNFNNLVFGALTIK